MAINPKTWYRLIVCFTHTRARARACARAHAQDATWLADAFLRQLEEHSAGWARAMDGRQQTVMYNGAFAIGMRSMHGHVGFEIFEVCADVHNFMRSLLYALRVWREDTGGLISMQRSSTTCSVTDRDWQSTRKLGIDCLFYAHARARARAQDARRLAGTFLRQLEEHSAG